MKTTPMSLLTKGQTIRGMKDRPSAYKLAKLVLPKFVARSPRGGATEIQVEMEAAQQPLLVPLKHAPPEMPTMAPDPVPFSAAKNIPIKDVVSQVTAPIEEPKSIPPLDRGRVEPLWDSGASSARTGLWRLLLERLTFRRRPVRVKTVQTELALERVAVLRNDLSDHDLEVKPRGGAKKRVSNPFRGAAQARRGKEAKEENSGGNFPNCGTMTAEPTD